MWRDDVGAWARGALVAWARARVLPRSREQVARAWREAQRRPEAVLVAALVVGVAAMIAHWS